MIIGLIGEKLAGKDTVAEYLVKKYGAEHIRASQILDELLDVLGLSITRRNEIDAGRGMEHVFGEHIIAQTIKRRIQASKVPVIISNGLRQKDQFDDVRQLGGKIIYITAPDAIRFQRLQQRRIHKDGENPTFEQFIQQEKEWTEVNIPAFGAEADFKIKNTGTLEELFAKVDEIINVINDKN